MKKAAKSARPKKPAAVAKTRSPSPLRTRKINATGPAFPIVGIGASAGGLEAMEVFLRNVPAGSGMAFVFVQHLDPTHKGILAELLQRFTEMKVVQVKDRTKVRPDCVYVIPPNKDMSILRGVLHLLVPVSPRGLRLPIDYFFRSLADDAKEGSVGVILSGMGTDGTLGLKAIKGKAGVVFVQDPATAKFDGMPRSAIEAGLADVVAPVGALPGKIRDFLHHVPLIVQPGLALEDKAHSNLEKITILLRAQTGHDFSLYKRTTIFRRIERRMGIHQISRMSAYVRFLQENPKELDLLFKELLIGVTNFFRDPEVWESLKAKVFPELLKNRPPSEALRIWIPGCSTGEEAYSMAIVFRETLEVISPGRNHVLQIFATDLDAEAIEKARAGIYPDNIAGDVSPERLGQFFVKLERGYQISLLIRESVIFALQNVIMDPPFTKLDLVSCRNLLIYLTPELQKKLLPLFHYALNPGGFLMLGKSETIGGLTDRFDPLEGKTRLFRKHESGTHSFPIDFPAAFTPVRPAATAKMKAAKLKAAKSHGNLQSQAEQFLLNQFAPAAVLVNDKGDIIFISGRTGKFLEPVAGKANWNVFAMARDGLRHELAGAFQSALRRKEQVACRNLKVRTDGGMQTVDVTVQPLSYPESLRGRVMIVFTEVTSAGKGKKASKAPRAVNARITAIEAAAEQARMELQTQREEMQSAQEEANSANEEMQSANEELQSTNEELTTSKEEMQSMNEELQTLNHELQARVEHLAGLNNDMKNLLETTEVATVFLDMGLRVRLFTAGSNLIFKLIPGDVGRPITDIASVIDYPELADDSREVLRTLVSRERPAAARDGRWFMARIMPYRTFENRIDGVVITFTDITAVRELETGLLKKQAGLERHIAAQDVKLEGAAESLRTARQVGKSRKGAKRTK